MSNSAQHTPEKAKFNLLPYIIGGLVLIGIGVAVNGQPWTTPEMFKALDLDFARVTINIGFFLAFSSVLRVFFIDPLMEAINERDAGLEKTFSEAENLRTEMHELRNAYEARLAKTEAEAREQIQSQIKEAQVLRQTLLSEATAKSDDLLKKAQLDIEAQRQSAILQVRSMVVDLTIQSTEKLTKKVVDNAANRELVEEFLNSPEVTV